VLRLEVEDLDVTIQRVGQRLVALGLGRLNGSVRTVVARALGRRRTGAQVMRFAGALHARFLVPGDGAHEVEGAFLGGGHHLVRGFARTRREADPQRGDRDVVVELPVVVQDKPHRLPHGQLHRAG
jgi:hypothetical protein